MKIDKNKLALIIDQVSEDHCNVNTREFRDDLVEKIHAFLTPTTIRVEYSAELSAQINELLSNSYIDLVVGTPGESITITSLGDLNISARSLELKAG